MLLVGPRGSGKTTTAARHAATVLHLDRSAERGVVEADPDAAISAGPRPRLIDEWQLVPDVLGAVKRAVDADFTGGQFLLTGSARSDLLTSGWAGTGRIVRLHLWGMTERELLGRGDGDTFLQRALDPSAELPATSDAPNLRGYVERALRGGLPQLARAASPTRHALLADAYVDQLVTRDVEASGSRRRAPGRLRGYLRAVALSTAGTPATERLLQAAGIDRATAMAYDDVLETLFVAQRVQPYVNNRLSRLVRRPKRYLAEPSLLGPLAGIDERGVLRDVDLLGRLLDTYVAAQLRPELELIAPRPQLLHLRDANGDHEVDLLVELADGRVLAIEIKASAAPTRDDARHLRWLRDRVGEDFVRGIVFHTGPRSFQYEPNIWYLPIAALWE